jgi:hypothetical protein
MEETQEPPWYRQLWPWLLMLPPAVSVVAGLLTFYLAGAEPAMVVDDYSRIAMATAQRVERAERAAELGINAQIVLADDRDNGVPLFTVTLTQHPDVTEWPAGLVLQFVHPTKQELDQTIKLIGSEGRYVGQPYSTENRSRYYVSLSDAAATWRLTGELTAAATTLELGSPGRMD